MGTNASLQGNDLMTMSVSGNKKPLAEADGRQVDWRVAILLVMLLLAAFAVRIYHPVSRSDNWLDRSYAFNDAVREHDWIHTYTQYHPGVTTMVIAGATLHAYQKVINSSGFPYTALQALFDWAIVPTATRYGSEVTVGVVGLAAVLTLLIGLIALVVIRLGGKPLGLTVAGLLAFSPYYLNQSRVLHVDAMLSTLMLLSALLILLYLRSGRWLHLVLSGLVGGLALLTKTPSVFLLPYTGLALGVGLLGRLRADWGEHTVDRTRWLVAEVGRGLALPLVVWLAMAALPFALWPAMWAEPFEILNLMYGSVSRHLQETHPRTRFFAGQLFAPGEPPNRLFYLAVLAFDTSFVTLTLAIVAVLIYALPRLRDRSHNGVDGGQPLPDQTFWLMVAYVFFFVLQMTIGEKQDQRYILPAFLMLNVIAAVGVIGLVGRLRARLASDAPQMRRLAPAVLPLLAIGFQALAGTPYAPDYGAHFNHLFGGNLVAVKVLEIADQTEGIQDVAAYLHQYADLTDNTVGTVVRSQKSLEQYYNLDQIVPATAEADYYLFSFLNQQRNLDPEDWLSTWQRLESQQPVFVVLYDGIEYLRLYESEPEPGIPTVVNHDGRWLIFLAWAWALMLVDILVRMLSPTEDATSGKQKARTAGRGRR